MNLNFELFKKNEAMKKNYEAPQIEVIEIVIEGAILQASGGATVKSYSSGGQAW